MKASSSMVLVLLLVALAPGCQRHREEGNDVKVELRVAPDPPKVGPAKLIFLVKDAEKPVAGATVKVEGTMSHAGMKPVFADAKEDEPGCYRADLEFTMAGDWIILVDGTLANGELFHKTIEVHGVKAD